MIFKNDSASTIDPFSLINLTGISVQENGQYWLTADKPDSAANFLLAVTGRLKVRAGKYGDCQPLCPVFQALYDSGDGTPANEENWGPDNGTHLLKKNFGGGHYAVIGVDTSETVALVMVTGIVERMGNADANIAGTSSGTVSILAGGTDTGDNVTATNMTDTQADSTKDVLLKYFDSTWNFLPLECPA